MKKNVAYSSLMGAILKEERVNKYMAQSDLQEKTGLVQSTVYRIEMGESCTINNLGSLCEVYGKNLTLLVQLAEQRAQAMVSDGYPVFWEMTPAERKTGKWMYGEELSKVSQAVLSEQIGIVLPGLADS